MVPPSVRAALAPTAEKEELHPGLLLTQKIWEITICMLKTLPSSANSIKAKRITEFGSPQIRQSTTYKCKR